MPCCSAVLSINENRLLARTAGRVRYRRQIGRSVREIPAARAHLVALMFGHFDADLVVAAIQNVVRRKIREGILVAELVADVLELLVQIIVMLCNDSADSGFLAKV